MAKKKATKTTAAAPPDEKPEKVALLTVEFHPIEGRIERWRMSDGTVERIVG